MLAKKLRAAGGRLILPGDGTVRWSEANGLTATSQAITNVPASGDLLFFFYYTDELSGDKGVTPTGWTNIVSVSSFANACNVCYKISDGTETSVAHGITDTTSISLGTYVLVCFQNVDPLGIDIAFENTSTNNLGVVDVGGAGTTDITIQAIGVDDQVSGVVDPPDFTEVIRSEVGTSGNGCTVVVSYKEGEYLQRDWTHPGESVIGVGLRFERP